MPNFNHNDHLAQGPHSNKTKKSGSHMEQGPHGAGRKKASGSHMEQGEGRATRTRAGGSHLTPMPAKSDKRGRRGAGDRLGHDRISPVAGKSKSGSPNINPRPI